MYFLQRPQSQVRNKLAIVGAIIALVIFLIATSKTAKADTSIDQQQSNAPNSTTLGTGWWIQNFTPSKYNINRLSVHVESDHAYEAYLCLGWISSDAEASTAYDCTGYNYVGYASVASTTSSTYATFSFDPPIVLAPEVHFYFSFHCTDCDVSVTDKYAGDTNDYYDRGRLYMSNHTSASYYDMDFTTWYESAPPDLIQIDFPNESFPVASTSTIESTITYQLNSASSSQVSFELYQLGAPNNIKWYETVTSDDNNVSTNFPLLGSPTYADLTHGTNPNWHLIARLGNLAYDELSFTISTAGGSTTSSPFSAPPMSTSTEMVLSCDSSSSYWDRSWCNLFQFLFKPSTEVMTLWSTLKTSIENKPPFGYFTQIKSAWTTNLTASSTPTFILVANNFGQLGNIFTPLRTGIAIIIWLSFLAYLYVRFRHFTP